MNRRGLLATGAAGSVLAAPNLANARPQLLRHRRRLVADGAPLRPCSRDILLACHKATQDTYAEFGDRNARFKRVHAHWDKFRRASHSWFRVAEDNDAHFLSIAERSWDERPGRSPSPAVRVQRAGMRTWRSWM